MKNTCATWRDSRRERMPGGQKWQVLKKDRQNLQLNTKQNGQKKPVQAHHRLPRPRHEEMMFTEARQSAPCTLHARWGAGGGGCPQIHCWSLLRTLTVPASEWENYSPQKAGAEHCHSDPKSLEDAFPCGRHCGAGLPRLQATGISSSLVSSISGGHLAVAI